MLQARLPDHLLVRLATGIREVRQLERNDDAVHHERVAESRAEAQEEHRLPSVAAERLHGRVVHHPHGAPEGALVVEAHPALPQVHWLLRRLVARDGAGIADRDGVEAPPLGRFTHLVHHLAWREARTGGDLRRGALAAREQLHVGSADVDDENFHGRRIIGPRRRRNLYARATVRAFALRARERQLCLMRPHFLAFRRVLPGGMIVLVSLDVAEDGQVRGILQVERRRDPTRQLFGTAPLIAEATGPTQQDVLRQLRELAENDAEVAARMAEWESAHPPRPRDRPYES